MLRKQILLLGNKKMFLPEIKNIFASWTQMLLSKHVSQLSHHENGVDYVPVLLIKNVSQQRQANNNG